ncbi:MAG: RNA polymerase sigma factor [Gammaproteobacteria bacterium]
MILLKKLIGQTAEDNGESLNSTHSQQLEEFLMDTERRAFRMAQLSTRNRDDALDIVQDAMMKLTSKYANKPADQWAPLFYRILNNRIMDFHRKNTTQSRWRVWFSNVDDEDYNYDPVQHAPSDDLSPSAMADLEDSVERVNYFIQQLSPRQRQAFLLRAWEGMDVAETAQIMKCSQGSVKTHYSRAVHFLRKQLQENL